MRTKTLAAPLVALSLLLAACGGGDDNGSEARPPDTTGTTGATTGSSRGGNSTSSGGEVPDPCTLLSSQQLSRLLGVDPGTGTVNASDPDQRKVCSYGTELMLAVEVSRNYEKSVDLIRQISGGAGIRDVPGVGSAAIWQDIGGGIGQFVARGPKYFVGVTLGTGGQSAGQGIAEAMLSAL